MQTCREIYEMIRQHCDCLSIFICAHAWANESGSLVADDMNEDDFLVLFGNNIPTDWVLYQDKFDNSIKIGFLFR